MPEPLICAALSFCPGVDIRANAATIAEAIQDSANNGVQMLVTPEAALTGYPEVTRDDLDTVDWRALATLEDELAEFALERRLVLVLGTASVYRSGLGDDALVCGAVEHEVRYRARTLTSRESRTYAYGETAVIFHVAGWRVGLGISYDLRFPALWGDLARRGAEAFAALGHFVGGNNQADIARRRHILPIHCASRAAEWVTPLILANTSDHRRWIDSAAWDACGTPIAHADGQGLLKVELHHRDLLDPFYQDLRGHALMVSQPQEGSFG